MSTAIAPSMVIMVSLLDLDVVIIRECGGVSDLSTAWAEQQVCQESKPRTKRSHAEPESFVPGHFLEPMGRRLDTWY